MVMTDLGEGLFAEREPRYEFQQQIPRVRTYEEAKAISERHTGDQKNVTIGNSFEISRTKIQTKERRVTFRPRTPVSQVVPPVCHL